MSEMTSKVEDRTIPECFLNSISDL